MSAVKHRPATPLPFPQNTLPFSQVAGHQQHINDAIGYEVAKATDGHRAAYLVRAANAYPKLVEALREVLRDRLTQANLHQMPPAMRQRLESARAALREIGEEA